jgi:hypothetical protein
VVFRLLFLFILALSMSCSQSFIIRGFFSQGSGSYGSNGGLNSMYFGLDYTETTSFPSTSNPPVTHGLGRFWDTVGAQWPFIESMVNNVPTYNWSTLDLQLSAMYSNNVDQAIYTMARTPSFATSNPTDTTCSDSTTGVEGDSPGQCDPPSDVASDGSGANTYWDTWVSAIVQHANGFTYEGNGVWVYDSTYLQAHTHISYWEPWNEPDSPNFWTGSYAQLVRLTEDARCIIKGEGVIHNYPTAGATPMTCAAYCQTNQLTCGIDPTAFILTPSYHAPTAVTYAKNFLYCDSNPQTTGPTP